MRLLLVALFGLFTYLRAGDAWRAVTFATEDRSLDAAVDALYDVLRLGVIASFGVFIALRGPSARPSRDPIAFAACAAAVVSLVSLQAPGRSFPAGEVLAGDVIATISCLWQLVAVLALGRCFGFLPEARGLVTRGPYRLVRHPVYLGELGACAGLIVAAPSSWNLGCGVAFAAAQAVRMRLEEQTLIAEFPSYSAYAATTPRLIPRLRTRGADGVSPLIGRARADSAPL
jgi:protein-S-isoprenylcysteine O-methyltransferase Ste14